MNFPDLETCRAIGDEFPESEFVWLDCSADEYHPIEFIVYHTDTHIVVPRGKHGIHKLLDNAPTCEELGEWLQDKGYILVPQNNNWYVYSKLSELYQFKINAPNETQARAEAVILTLKENQKWSSTKSNKAAKNG